MRASKPSAAGFTLIEVLAALVIVSLGMLGVIEAVTQTASNSTRMRDRTIAHWVAMNQLTAARLESRALDIAKTSDEVEMAGRRWRWTMEVSETPIESMRRIDIQVAEVETEGDEGRVLASNTGFQGTAIAAAGMGTLPWSGAGPTSRGSRGAEQPPPQDDGGTQEPPPVEPPPASDPQEVAE
jgi:general secretion pathway protein I